MVITLRRTEWCPLAGKSQRSPDSSGRASDVGDAAVIFVESRAGELFGYTLNSASTRKRNSVPVSRKCWEVARATI